MNASPNFLRGPKLLAAGPGVHIERCLCGAVLVRFAGVSIRMAPDTLVDLHRIVGAAVRTLQQDASAAVAPAEA